MTGHYDYKNSIPMSDDVDLTDFKRLGLGTDLVEIERFRSLAPDAPFYQRVFTESERQYCMGFPDSAIHYASTFAAKEAVLKSLPSTEPISLRSIEILRDQHGSPKVRLAFDHRFRSLVSITHTGHHAAAVAISHPISESSDTDQMRKLLNGALSEILPE